MHDLVVRGGRVVDGTGAPAGTADVAITGGIITQVGAGVAGGRTGDGAHGRVDGPARQEIGYVRTIEAGGVTFADGEYTGATPGRLLRGTR